jgi:predicted Zn-dependent protease
MDNEEELAGILGHEIAHVACRHISDRIERSEKISMATLAGIAAGILLGVGGVGSVANAVTFGSIAAGQSASLAYSREDERQADQAGLLYLEQAGYSGRGLLKMLNKIRNKQWFGSEQIPTYLKTHPGTEDRMAYIDTWLANNQNTHQSISDAPSYKISHGFQKAHMRLITLYGEEKALVNAFEKQLEANPSDPMANYGYGLLLQRTGNRREAASYFKKSTGAESL